MGIAMFALSVSLMWSVWADGLAIGWLEGRGPGAGAWPFWLSLGMALAALWTLLRWHRGVTPESRDTSSYIDSESVGLVITSFVALTVMIYLVNVVGTYIAIALFLGFYMKVLGGHRWSTTLAMCVGAVIFVYFLFEWQLTKYLPKGLPIFEEGFLWIDNYRWEYLM